MACGRGALGADRVFYGAADPGIYVAVPSLPVRGTSGFWAQRVASCVKPGHNFGVFPAFGDYRPAPAASGMARLRPGTARGAARGGRRPERAALDRKSTRLKS